MSEANLQTAIAQQLGPLHEAFEQYREIVETTLPNSWVDKAYRQEVINDKRKEAKDKLPAEAGYEEFRTAMHKAVSKRISTRDEKILEQGFAGTINKLFDDVIAVQTEEELDSLAERIDWHQKLPAERRLGAKVVSQAGYYWGGRFTRFEEQAT